MKLNRIKKVPENKRITQAWLAKQLGDCKNATSASVRKDLLIENNKEKL